MANMGQKKTFFHCDIYTGDEVLKNHAVCVSGNRILSVPRVCDLEDDGERIDLHGKLLAPSFMDVQVNGGGGVLFYQNPTIEALEVIAKAHRQFGTLNFCPTILSADMDTIKKGLEAVRLAKDRKIGILGVHLEGPFLEPSKSGIHETKYIHPASDREIQEILQYGDGNIRIMTVAPEAVSDRQVAMLLKEGIKVFLGHTNAACGQALDAFCHGVHGVTHLYNAMSQLGSREPGVVGASFVDSGSWAGIIVDGYHVDYQSVKIAKAIKKNRLFFVTDAMPPVGKPEAAYRIGEVEVSCVNGRCAAPDGTLAGSALDMASAVRNAVRNCGIPLEEAIRMASTDVARMLGVDDSLGYIKSGMAADMVVLDRDLHVDAIICQGEYSAV